MTTKLKGKLYLFLQNWFSILNLEIKRESKCNSSTVPATVNRPINKSS